MVYSLHLVTELVSYNSLVLLDFSNVAEQPELYPALEENQALTFKL